MTFLWNLLFLLRYPNVLIPSLPQLLASSCPGSYGRVGGSAGLCFHPPASMAPDPQRLSGSPHWVTIPPKIESASYSEGKYSVGTNEVLL